MEWEVSASILHPDDLCDVYPPPCHLTQDIYLPDKEKYPPAFSDPPLWWFRPDPSLLLWGITPPPALPDCLWQLPGGEQNTSVYPQTHPLSKSTNQLLRWSRKEGEEEARRGWEELGSAFAIFPPPYFLRFLLSRIFHALRNKEMSFFQLLFDLSSYLRGCLDVSYAIRPTFSIYNLFSLLSCYLPSFLFPPDSWADMNNSLWWTGLQSVHD